MNLTVTTNQMTKNLYKYTQRRERNPDITLNIVIKSQGKKGTKKNFKNNQKTVNKMQISTYLSIITINVNKINAPIKRHRVAE